MAQAPPGYCDITVRIKHTSKSTLNQMALDFDYKSRNELLDHLCRCYQEGRLLMLDQLTKQAIIGAAEDRVLSKAQKAARSEVLYQLYIEGYRADPYER